MVWIPRSLNDRADYISRIVDFDNWKVNQDVFYWMDGPHTIDCFESNHKTQLQRFHSRFWNPGSEAVDTFTVLAWSTEVCWWVPPLQLVYRLRTIQHARKCQAQGTLFIPLWKSAPF